MYPERDRRDPGRLPRPGARSMTYLDAACHILQQAHQPPYR